MSVRLYVEGGGDRNSKIACRAAFRSFVGKAGAEGRMPKIIASGSRNEAYDDFKAVHAQGNVTAMLLVDAEEEVTVSGAWEHLRSRDNWRRPPGASNDQCHLMVQFMESWFLADRPALQEFYGHRFRSRALPGNQDIEQVPKQNVLNGLRQASRATPKGVYDKGAHSFEILGALDPGQSHSRISLRQEIRTDSPRSVVSRCPLQGPRPRQSLFSSRARGTPQAPAATPLSCHTLATCHLTWPAHSIWR